MTMGILVYPGSFWHKSPQTPPNPESMITGSVHKQCNLVLEELPIGTTQPVVTLGPWTLSRNVYDSWVTFQRLITLTESRETNNVWPWDYEESLRFPLLPSCFYGLRRKPPPFQRNPLLSSSIINTRVRRRTDELDDGKSGTFWVTWFFCHTPRDHHPFLSTSDRGEGRHTQKFVSLFETLNTKLYLLPFLYSYIVRIRIEWLIIKN